MAVVVVKRTGVAWVHGFGVRDASGGDPVTGRTVFEAASLGKPVFAYAVLRLASERKIDLDRPVSQYWKNPELSRDPRNDLVTASMLLSHQSGLPNVRDDLDSLSFIQSPGSGFSYSSEGFLYLQQVIEHITNESTDEFVRRYVFHPLGMDDSSFEWRPDFEGRAALGTDGAGRPVPLQKTGAANVSGGLETTAADYGKFLLALLEGWGLSPSVRARMMKPAVTVWSAPVKGTAERMSIAWGQGIGLQVVPGEGTSFWQWGDLTFFRSFMEGYPTRGVAMAYLTNSINGLSIAGDVAALTVGGANPAIAWLGYE